MNANIRKKSAILLLLVILLPLFSCASGGVQSEIRDENHYGGTGSSEGEKSPESIFDNMQNGADISERKIIKTVTLMLETKEFDSGIDMISRFAAENNGYIESSNVSGSSYGQSARQGARNATYRIRIPVDALETYISGIGENFNITSKKEDAEDISDTYYDIEARLNSLRTQEERLLDMLEKASTLEYMLELEDKLASVRYNIESLTASMRRYDNLVAYSTINITLREVIDYTSTADPKTFPQRMGVAFVESWRGFIIALGDFAVGLAYALPLLITLALILLIITLIVKGILNKRDKKLRDAYISQKADNNLDKKE